MNDSYKQYIGSRLKVGSKLSSQHLYAVTAVDCYEAEKEFYLLQFYFSECLLLKCVTSNEQPRKIGVDSWKRFRHNLNEIYKDAPENKKMIEEEAYYVQKGVCLYDLYYDILFPALSEYNERIVVALKDIELKSNMPVYVCSNERYSTKAVMYALQSKATRVVMMQKVKEKLICTEFRRVLHMQDFDGMFLKTSPAVSVVDCFNPQTIYVPLVDETLDSEFCNGKRWRDLLTNTETLDCCTINGVSCKCVTIETNIDIFNNVFCMIKSDGKLYNAILLYNALGTKLVEENTVYPSVTTVISKAESVFRDDFQSSKKQQIEPQVVKDIIPKTRNESNVPNLIEQHSTLEEQDGRPYSMPLKPYGPVEGYEGIKLEIGDNDKYLIETLFGYYLFDNGGVTEICFRDAYLYQSITLLTAFVNEMLSKLDTNLSKFRSFKIMTLPQEKIKPQNDSYKKRLAKFESNRNLLKRKLKKYNVNLVHEYLQDGDLLGRHKRTLIFDNGWCIDMEGGLNKLYKGEKEISMGVCGKTTLYYYNVKPGLHSVNSANPYVPIQKGKRCVVKIITPTERGFTLEKLFRYYLLDKGGTSHIILRDRYFYLCPKMLQTLMEKLIGFAYAANSENKDVRKIEHVTLYIAKKDNGNRQRVENFEKIIENYKSKMSTYNVEVELRELSNEDKDGDHKRCIIFEDNGWCIDLEGGIEKLYKEPDDMRYGRSQSTTLYYCKEQNR